MNRVQHFCYHISEMSLSGQSLALVLTT